MDAKEKTVRTSVSFFPTKETEVWSSNSKNSSDSPLKLTLNVRGKFVGATVPPGNYHRSPNTLAYSFIPALVSIVSKPPLSTALMYASRGSTIPFSTSSNSESFNITIP